MKKLIFAILLALAGTAADATNFEMATYCAHYEKVRLRNVERVLAVGIKQVFNDKVEIYVLGYGSPIRASFNNVKIGQSHVMKLRTITCKGENVGQVRIYDLSFLNISEGLFKIKSGDKEASTYILIN